MKIASRKVALFVIFVFPWKHQFSKKMIEIPKICAFSLQKFIYYHILLLSLLDLSYDKQHMFSSSEFGPPCKVTRRTKRCNDAVIVLLPFISVGPLGGNSKFQFVIGVPWGHLYTLPQSWESNLKNTVLK